MKDYPEELQKAAGSRHQKWKYPKNISSSATVQNDVKYVRLWTEAEDKILRESIMLRRAVRYVIA